MLGRGEGPGALPRRRAASPRRPAPAFSSFPGRPPTPPPSLSQGGKTALDIAKEDNRKAYPHSLSNEVIKLLKNDPAYLAAQVGRAAPRRAATSSAYPHLLLERGTERPVPKAQSL